MVLMNFFIAVVNQSYETCLCRYILMSFKIRVDFIVEKESMMSEKDLQNRDWFPNFIILRATNDNAQTSDWQGYVKKSNLLTNYQVNELNQNIKSEMYLESFESNKRMKEISKEMSENKAETNNKIESIL